MELLPELSLAPTSCNNSSSELSDTGSSRKRKALSQGFSENKSIRAHRSIDLQHSNERLPIDWEQCLDLQSGKMYFLNRKTLKKSWDRPSTATDHHKLDLELNIYSSPKEGPVLKNNSPNSYLKSLELVRVTQAIQSTRKDDHHLSSLASYKEIINSSNNMVAMACMSCHLLVIVSKSNPTCPNCKYVHCIRPDQHISPAPRNPTTFKPLDTLSLFS